MSSAKQRIMKRTLVIITLTCAAFGLGPVAGYADHDKNCKAIHGTVSAKTDNSITVNGKAYTLDTGATVMKDDKTVALSSINVGDKVCLEMPAKGTDANHVSKLVVLDKDYAVRDSDRTAACGRTMQRGSG